MCQLTIPGSLNGHYTCKLSYHQLNVLGVPVTHSPSGCCCGVTCNSPAISGVGVHGEEAVGGVEGEARMGASPGVRLGCIVLVVWVLYVHSP